MRLLEIHATSLKAAVSVESPRFLALLTSLLHAQRSKIIRALFVLENTLSVLFSSRFFRCLSLNCLPMHFFHSRAQNSAKPLDTKCSPRVAQQSASKCLSAWRQNNYAEIYLYATAPAKRLEVAPASAASTQWQQGSMEREKY